MQNLSASREKTTRWIRSITFPARRSALAASAVAVVGVVAGGITLSGQGPREWRDYGGGPDSSHFVAARQINKSNVSQLRVAWTYAVGQTGSSPIVARGVVYGRGTNNSLVALDAATGKELWRHEGLQGITIRGVNYWDSKDGADRRLIFSINDELQEIDARTGVPIEAFGNGGKVNLKLGLDRDPSKINVQSGTPGRVFENLLILGSMTNQEYGSAPGDIRAFDVRTGALVWTFHTVPRPGEFGYDTWPPDAWKTVGGANNWGEQSIDDRRGIVYVPTGSAKFNFYGGNRLGANLFGDCLIALDARTGKRLWHFQTVHHDIWDLDNNSAPQLTSIRQNGRTIDVVAMASKTGYLYVFDRVTGQPIWPIEERPVPTRTDVPGEVVSPTQPFPTNPPPFSRQKFTADDVNPYILTPPEREAFRQRLLKARNDGPFTPIGFDEVVHMPGNQGGSNWGSTAANPGDGSVYVIGFNVPTILRLLKPGEPRAGRRGNAAAASNQNGSAGASDTTTYPPYYTDGFGLFPTIVNPPYTTLTSYDLNSGTIRWQIGLGDDLRLVAQGITGTGTAGTTKGGIIPTAAGLVFVTAADHKVHVYDSGSGKQVWEIALGGATSGSPAMYELGGRQYLLVTASADSGRGARGGGSGASAPSGPTGIVAYTLGK
jgi:quinoprotein glucose dehydrogenase